MVDVKYMTRGPEIPFRNAGGFVEFCQRKGVTVANFMQAAWAVV